MYSRVFFGDCRAGWINDITLGWGCSPRFKWKGEQNNIKDSLLKSRLTTTSWTLEIDLNMKEIVFFIPHGRRWHWGRPYFDCVDGRRQQVIHELQALAGFVRKHQRKIGLDWMEAMLKGKSFGNYWKHSPAWGWWSVFHFVAYVLLECGLIVGSWGPNSLFCQEEHTRSIHSCC